ncbi:hypothetical protein [Photobacterium swingsii]|uniref:hypothetical protein n=1 Tax=Photobacterium swingsii TaxID=680026 RepID=UPI00406820B5
MYSNNCWYSVMINAVKSLVYCCVLFPSFLTYSSNLPASIDRVMTYRVNDYLVRVIEHNTEVNPILEIDKITTPEYKVINGIAITSVDIGGERLLFNKSSGVYIESISVKNTNVLFSFEYFYLEGGSNFIDCVVAITAVGIDLPNCTYQK